MSGRGVDVVSVNGKGSYKVALRVALDTMASELFHVGFGVNDHSAIAIAEASERTDQNIAVYATGGENTDFLGRLANRKRIHAIAAFFPKFVGERAIDILWRHCGGNRCPNPCSRPM